MTGPGTPGDVDAASVDSSAYVSLLRVLSPPLDDTGHAPNCGYTDEEQECGCAEMGHRLWRWVAEHAAQVRAQARREVAEEIAAAIEPHPDDGCSSCVMLREAARIARAAADPEGPS